MPGTAQVRVATHSCVSMCVEICRFVNSECFNSGFKRASNSGVCPLCVLRVVCVCVYSWILMLEIVIEIADYMAD
jgi:hypothetical protein